MVIQTFYQVYQKITLTTQNNNVALRQAQGDTL